MTERIDTDDTDDTDVTNVTNVTDDHVADLPDGAGCTEIWEHLSERRDSDE